VGGEDGVLFVTAALFSAACGRVYHYTHSQGRAFLVGRLSERGIPQGCARRCLALSHSFLELSSWLPIAEEDANNWSILNFGDGSQEDCVTKSLLRGNQEGDVLAGALRLCRTARIFESQGARSRALLRSLFVVPEPLSATDGNTPETILSPISAHLPDAAATHEFTPTEGPRTGPHSSSTPVSSPTTLLKWGSAHFTTQTPPVSPGWGSGSGFLRGPMASATSGKDGKDGSGKEKAKTIPASKSITNLNTALALWTRTKGMCCWLLTNDLQPCRSAGSLQEHRLQHQSSSFSDSSESVTGECIGSRVVLMVRSATERRDAPFCLGSVSLLGNFLACPRCCRKLRAWQGTIIEALADVSKVFAGNSDVCRFTARALYYYFRSLEHLAQADLVRVEGASQGKGKKGRYTWAGNEIFCTQTRMRRRDTDPLINLTELERVERVASTLFSGGSEHEGVTAHLGLSPPSSGSAGRDGSFSSLKGGECIHPPPHSNDAAYTLKGEDIARSLADASASGDRAGMVALFEMIKTSDGCQLAWVSNALRTVFSVLVKCPAAGHPKAWAQTALEDRRPSLLLKLVNHLSPLVCANALQSLAYLSHCLHEQRVTGATRAIYLSGVMYSVVQTGLRGLMCVTAPAAHVVEVLSADPANVENMLEASNPTFSFITYLTSLGAKPLGCSSTISSYANPVTFKYVGVWQYPRYWQYPNTESVSNQNAGKRLCWTLPSLGHDDLLSILKQVVAAIRGQRETEGYFALSEGPRSAGSETFELSCTVGSTAFHETYPRGDFSGREVIPVQVEDKEGKIEGCVTQVAHRGQLAIYHISGITEEEKAVEEETLQDLAELAWGERGAAIYQTSQQLDLIPWEKDEVLLDKARNLGLLTLVNMGHACKSEAMVKKFVTIGGLDLLLSLVTKRRPPLDNTGLSCVGHALYEFVTAVSQVVVAERCCVLNESQFDEMRAVVKMLLRSTDDRIQSDAGPDSQKYSVSWLYIVNTLGH
jgi:hypothetical protein